MRRKFRFRHLPPPPRLGRCNGLLHCLPRLRLRASVMNPHDAGQDRSMRGGRHEAGPCSVPPLLMSPCPARSERLVDQGSPLRRRFTDERSKLSRPSEDAFEKTGTGWCGATPEHWCIAMLVGAFLAAPTPVSGVNLSTATR